MINKIERNYLEIRSLNDLKDINNIPDEFIIKYIDLDDFSQNASSEEMVGLLKGINTVAKKLGISVDTGKGYRALANISEDGGQEVPHLHFHLFGGEKIGKMVS